MKTLIPVITLAMVAFAGCVQEAPQDDGIDQASGEVDENAANDSADQTVEEGGSGSDSESQVGSASIYVKDAPTDEFDEIHVVFSKVEVHYAGNGSDEDEESDEQESAQNESEEESGGNETESDGNETESDGNETESGGNETESDGNETESGGNETETGNQSESQNAKPENTGKPDHAGNESRGKDNGSRESDGNGSEGDDGSWITLYADPNGTDVDLLAANGSAAAFLGEAQLQAGKYTQIRITALRVYGVVGNETVNISFAPTPLKVIKPFDVEAGGETRIIVDYDLDRSLKETGPNGWRMIPVIGRTVVDHVDDATSGADAHKPGEIGKIDSLDA